MMWMSLLLTAAVAAPETPPTPGVTVLSLNTSGVMGFATLNVGRMGFNVEHVVRGRHGLLVEAGIIHVHGDPSHLWSGGGALGWRYHFGGATDAPFVGVRVAAEAGWGRYMPGMGEGLGMSGAHGGEGDVPLDVLHLNATAHVGYRWQVAGRVQLTYRVGAGYGHTVITAREDGMFANDAEAFSMDRFQRFPFVVDTELSVGIRFGRRPVAVGGGSSEDAHTGEQG